MITTTPLTKAHVGGWPVFLKREDLNPFGSHKIHAVKNYIEHSIVTERLTAAKVLHLLVSSSGRFVQALAMYTQGMNIQLKLVSDVLSSCALLNELAQFKHVVIDQPLIDSPDRTGSHLPARLRRIDELLQAMPGSIFVDQYADPILAEGYQKSLLPQIVEQAGGDLGGIFLPVGTGGLVNGAVRYRKQCGADFPIFAVDAEGSALLRIPPPGVKRKLPGYGNGIQTKLIAEVADDIVPVWVRDIDAVAGCYELLAQGIRVGPSSGAAAAGFRQVLRDDPERLVTDKPIVILLPDSGTPYTSTAFDPSWLLKNGLSLPEQGRRAA